MTVTINEMKKNFVKYLLISKDKEIIITDSNKVIAKMMPQHVRGERDNSTLFQYV